MAAVVLDTSIVIDLLQGYPPALAWQQTRTDNSTEFLLSAIICMEVVEGTINKRELEKTLRFLRKFSWVETASNDLTRAFEQFSSFYLSYGVDIADCLIAAPCQPPAIDTLHP